MRLKCSFGLLLAFAFVGLLGPKAYGQTVLNFPRVISNTNLFTGLAVGNPTAADVSVTFTAFQPDGTPFAATGIQNPVTVTIPAGGQFAKLFGEIFGARDFNGWAQATSGGKGLTGFFLNGNWSLTDLDGAGAVNATAEFILPVAAEDSVTKTEVTILNVSTEATVATVTLYTSAGTILATQDLNIAARGLVRQTLRTIFPSADLSTASHLKVRSDRPLVGHEVLADFSVPGTTVRRETLALSGQSPTSATSYALPQFATGGGWLSLLGVVNGAGVGQEVTLTAYKEDGSLWDLPSNPKRISLNGNGALQMTAGELFGFSDGALSTGWIEVRGSVGFLSSYIGFGTTAAPSFAAVAGTEVSSASKYQVFSHVAEGGDFFTGLTLINPGTEEANVEFYTLRADGTTVGRATFVVKPKERVGKLFSEMLPASLNQLGGWAFVRSSQPVIGAVLFGSANGYSLANVPQQIPAGDFIPPAQTTGAISGVVRAGGEPIANVQITLSGPVITTTVTDSLGRYTFPQLPAGDYKVAALRLGAQFVPAERSVTINRQNVDGVNFEGGGIISATSPVIQFISPTSTYAGNTSFNIRVLGQNFTPLSVIKLNNQALTTSFVNATELQAVITTAQLAQAATLKIVVETPPPGGGTSLAMDFTITAAPSDPLIAGRAPVGSFPTGVVIDSVRNTALVTNQASDSVTVVDLVTSSIRATIAVGRSPAEGIAVHRAKGIALVANPGSNNVSVINLDNNTVSKEISVGRFPVGIAINPATNRAVVANAEDGTISVIDLDSLTATGQITVGTRPLNVAIQTRSNQALVTDPTSNVLWIVDLNTSTVLGNVRVGQFPRGVAVNSATNMAVVTNANSNEASVVDLATRAVVSTVKVDVGPTGVAIHEGTNQALITNSNVPRGSTNYNVASTVSVLDLAAQQVTRTIPVGSAAFGIDVDQDGQRAVVANFGSNDITVIRAPNPRPRIDSVTPTTFPAGGGAFTITVQGAGFLPSSIVTLNGQSLPTTYGSYSVLRAEVSGALLDGLLQVSSIQLDEDKPGTFNQVVELRFDVGVSNPGPGGGDAPTRARITPQNAQPVLISVFPLQGTAGVPTTLTLSGNNFNGTSIINFGTTRHSPKRSTLTTMTVDIPARDLVSGTFQVSVTNPAPGGGDTVSFTFRVDANPNVTPTVTRVTPSSIPAGSGATVVTVDGTGFAAGASAILGSTQGSVSGSTVIFNLSAAQLQQPGTLSGLITNPTGGSAGFTVSVLNPAPTISTFSPASADAGSPALTISVSGSDFRSNSQITIEGTPIATRFVSATSLSGTIPDSILARAGDVTVGVTNPAPGGGSARGGTFRINSPVPTLTGATPPKGAIQATSLSVRLSGTGFVGNSSATANGTALATVFDSNTSLTVTIPASMLARAGVLELKVVNPAPGGGTSGGISFPVENPVPVLSSVTPSTVRVDQFTGLLTANGRDFVDGATMTVGSVTVSTTLLSPTQLTAQLSPPYPVGRQTVVITNPTPGGGTSSGFDVDFVAASPTIGTVSPGNVGPGEQIEVTGTNFGPGSTIMLRNQPILTTASSTTQLTGTIPATAATGSADVFVRNPATTGQNPLDSGSVTIQIVNPVPVIRSLSPTSAQGGASISISGSGFVPTSQVLLNGAVVTSSFSSASSMSFTLPNNTPAGTATVQVLNGGPGGGASNTVSLTVAASTPVLSGLSPSTGTAGANVVLTVTGSRFAAGAILMFNGSPAITTSFVSDTSLISVVSLPGSAGAVSAFVRNPGGLDSNSVGFVVQASTPPPPPPPPPVPTVTQISPNTGVAGTTVNTVVITGTNLTGATSVNVSGSGVTVGTVTVNSATQLTTSFTIASNATAGVRTVSVTTANGTSGTVNFTITSATPAPTLTQISPNTGAAGTTVSPVIITGSNFTAGTTVSVSGTGVTVGSVTVDSATQVTTSFTIASNATTGARNVTVTTTGGTSPALTFTITPAVPGAPTLSSVLPNTGVAGTTVTPVTLNGTNFLGASVAVDGTGVTVGTITVVSATEIQTSFTIASNATPGTRNVTVTTTAGTSNAVTFTITAAGPAFTVSPTTGSMAGGTRIVITGTNFTSTNVTVRFGTVFGAGAVRLSSTQVAVFTPPHAAGASDVTVTSGTAQTVTNAFTFTSAALAGNAFSGGPILTGPRYYHASTLLNDGRVLVAGGVDNAGNVVNTTDISNASATSFSAGPAMGGDRSYHTATPLADGRVLLAGGYSDTTALNTTELLNASGTAFTAGPALASARFGHTATLLADGRVLLAGGYDNSNALATAQVFDPVANTWSASINMTSIRINHQATLLPDGRVLITGTSQTAEIFDPATNAFSASASMTVTRSSHIAVLMADGRVLIAGGSGSVLSSAETFNGTTFTATGSMPSGSVGPVAVLLGDGKVLVAGGDSCDDGCETAVSAVFNPSTGTFTAGGNMAQARYYASAVGLPNGTALVVGGYGNAVLSSTEVFGAAALPTITSLIPGQRVVNSGAFALDVFGTNFVSGSRVVFNGTTYSATFLDAQHIMANIAASEISSTACSSPPCTFNVKAQIPDPINTGSYIDSNTVTFNVISAAITITPSPTVNVSVNGTTAVTVAVNQVVTAAAGIDITVTSNATNIATVTTPAHIAQGQTATTVNVTGVAVGSAQLTASLAGYASGSTNVNVAATAQPTVNVSPAALVLNAAGNDTITVSRVNSNNSVSLDVTLTQSRTGYVNLPTTVTIPATQSQVVVPISGVAPDPTPPVVVTASAANHVSGTNSLISVQILQIQMTPALLVNPAATASLVITISSPAPATVQAPCTQPGLCVTLVSGAAATATVVSSVLIPQGQVQATAAVTGVATGNTTVTASANGYSPVQSQIQVQNVNLSFVPGSATFFAGANYAQSVTLIMSVAAVGGGQVVNLSSSDTSAATVPASVTIPSGSTTVNVTVTGVGSGTATITASSPGLNNGTYTATVIAPTVRINNGESVVGTMTGVRQRHTVYISNPAPIGGVPVTITSSDSTKLLVAPCDPLSPQSSTCTDTNPPQSAATISIPTGQTYAYFDIVGQDIAEDEVRFRDPIGVVRDAAGNAYIADYQSHVIRKIDAGTGIITTIAGNGTNAQTGDNGPASAAAVGSPTGLTIYNNELYIAAFGHGMVRKINLANNIITTPVPSGTMSYPYQIAFDSNGVMYIADDLGSRLYRFTAAGGLVVVAGGGSQAGTTVGVAATSLSIGRVVGVAVDTQGNLYYTDYNNHIVNQIAATGIVTRVAGNGSCANSPDTTDAVVNGRLCYPTNLAYHPSSRALYISDRNNYRIVRVTLNATEPSATPRPMYRVAGSPTGQAGCCGNGLHGRAGLLYTADGLSVDSNGNLLIGDRSNLRVREISFATGVIDTLAGGGGYGYSGDGLRALSNHLIATAPNFITQRLPIDIDQSYWSFSNLGLTQNVGAAFNVAVRANNTNDRMANATSVSLSSLAGGLFNVANSPITIPLNGTTATFSVTATTNGTGQLQVAANVNGNNTRFSLANTPTITALPVPTPAMTIDGSFSPEDTGSGVRRRHYVQLPANATSPVPVTLTVQGGAAQVSQCNTTSPTNSTCDGLGTVGSSVNVTIPTGTYYAYFDLIGGATAVTETRVNSPSGVAVDASGAIYFADYGNYRIRKLAGGVLSTIVGSGSSTPALGATPLTTGLRPRGVTVDAAGNVYAVSENGHVVYQVTTGGAISIVAGTQNTAGFPNLYDPWQVAIGGDGSLYIADFDNHRVRKVPFVSGSFGTMTSIAGGGSTTPAAGVAATQANLGRISGVAVDPVTDEVYFSAYDGQRVWKFSQTNGLLELVAGTGTGGYNGDQADATLAQLYYPSQLNFRGNALHITDYYNHRIRRVTTNVSPRPLLTVAGSTSAGYNGDGDPAIISQLYYPLGVTTDSSGNVYIGDTSNHRIRQVLASNGTMQTIIGNGTAGFAGDGPGGGRGTTLRATATGYLPVEIGVDVQQSQWNIANLSATQTTSSSFTFTVRAQNSSDRMAADTTFNMTSTAPTVFTVPAQATITNNSTNTVVTATTLAAGGNGQVQILATGSGPTFNATTSAVITVLPAATPAMTIDGSFSPEDTGSGVRRRHYVQLPTNATSPVPVTLTVQGGAAQVSQCNTTSPTNSTCDGLGTVGSSVNVTIPTGTYYAYFDLIGGATAATETRVNSPSGVAVDASGAIYFADYSNYRIRKLAGGVLSTIVGSGSSTPALGGTPLTTGLRPRGVAVDAAGNVYAVSENGHVVYQVTPGGAISIVAGTQNNAGFPNLYDPWQVAIGGDGSLYIADFDNHRVRKVPFVSGSFGTMTSIAGGGSTTPAAGVAATQANLGRISGVAVDPVTDDVYFSAYDGQRVWKFSQANGLLELVAGTGTGGYNGDLADATLAQLYYPSQLNFRGNALHITDYYNHRIRKVITNTSPRPIMTVAGTTSAGYNGDGDPAIISRLYYPLGVTTDSSGNVYIGDTSNHRIRQVLASNGTMQTIIGNGTAGFAGDGPGGGRGTTLRATAAGYLPVEIGVDVQQSQWNIANLGAAQTTSSSFTFTVRPQSSSDRMAANTTFNMTSTAPTVFTVPATGTINNNLSSTVITGTTLASGGSGQIQIEATGSGPTFNATSSAVITVLPAATPPVTIEGGFGTQETATGVRQRHYVSLPSNVTGSPVTVNITSSDASRVGLSLCDPANSQNSTCTGTSPTAAGISVTIPVNSYYAYFDLIGLTAATPDVRVNSPTGVAVDGSGTVYFADYNNYRVRRLSGGVLSTFAGTGSSTPSLGGNALGTAMRPRGVAVNGSGNVFVASENGHVVYQITPTGAITIVAGTQNNAGFPNLYNPWQVAIGGDGSLYIADFDNNRVRKVPFVSGSFGSMTSIAGGGSTTPAAGVLATQANLGRVSGVAVDPVTDEVYFSAYDGQRVWKFSQANGLLELVAGTGTGGYNGDQADATLAQVYYPANLSFRNNALHIADYYNHRIRKVTTNVSPRPLMTVAGTTSGGFNGDGDLAIISQLYYPLGVTTDASGNVYIADTSNYRIRQVLASDSKIQTIIANGNAGFGGDGLPGRGVTITASIATGGPTHLPVTIGVNVEQSSWSLVSFPTTTAGPTFNFTVRQTSNAGTSMRMNSTTAFSLTPNVGNVLSLPATITILNNGTTPSFAISAIARSSNVVTVTVPTGTGIAAGQLVTISGVSDSSFNGTFTVTGTPTATTFTYAQTAANASSSNGTVTSAVASTIGSGTAQIIAQASSTGIALGASSNITVTPVFTNVTPSSGSQGVHTVTITGVNLLGATAITTAATGVSAAITNVSGNGQTMTATITVGATATTGAKTMTIVTPTGSPTFTFTVN